MNSNHNYKLPQGFQASGISAGLKVSGKPDLALILMDKPATVGAVYTKNAFSSVHVQYCRELTPSKTLRAIIINSGNANAATGIKGIKGNQTVVRHLSDKLGIQADQVLTSSTGVIGVPFPSDIITQAIPSLIDGLQKEGKKAAEAIMTTDTVIKTARAELSLNGASYSVYGIAKGSGMIHPNMGTMLAYVMTDAPIPSEQIQSLCLELADKSFNRVTVDGDTSTNDTFFLVSSNHEDVQESSRVLITALEEVCISLAKQIAADGEGAEHLIELEVKGAISEDSAYSIIQEVLTSSLVKTAIHGKDPNWGRILMATGNAIEKKDYGENPAMSVAIQNTPVFHKGEPVAFNESELANLMKKHLVQISIDLHAGSSFSTGWSCDLSKEYITINADYTT